MGPEITATAAHGPAESDLSGHSTPPGAHEIGIAGTSGHYPWPTRVVSATGWDDGLRA